MVWTLTEQSRLETRVFALSYLSYLPEASCYSVYLAVGATGLGPETRHWLGDLDLGSLVKSTPRRGGLGVGVEPSCNPRGRIQGGGSNNLNLRLWVGVNPNLNLRLGLGFNPNPNPRFQVRVNHNLNLGLGLGLTRTQSQLSVGVGFNPNPKPGPQVGVGVNPNPKSRSVGWG